MAGYYPKNHKGPLTFRASQPISGGQLVTPDGTTGGIKPAGATDTIILGVALTDARPYAEGEHHYDTAYGAPVMDVSVPGDEVAVTFFDVVEVPTTGTLTFGQLVQPAANGAVGPHSTGTVVGRCVSAEGVVSGGRAAVVLMLLGSATVTTSGA